MAETREATVGLLATVRGKVEEVPLRVRVHLALLTVQVIFALNVVLVRWAVRETPNVLVILGREIVCTVVLTACARMHTPSSNFKVTREHWLRYFVPCGALGVCGHLFLVSYGIQETDAVTSAVFATSRPMFAAVVLAAFGMGQPNARLVAGLALGAVGVAVAVEVWSLLGVGPSSGQRAGKPNYAIGCLALLVSDASYGAYLVFLKRALQIACIPLPLLLSRTFFVGLCGIIALTLVIDGITAATGYPLLHIPTTCEPHGAKCRYLLECIPRVSWSVWVVSTFGGIVVSPVPYALNGFAVQQVSPSIVALYSDIETPIIAWLAAVFLHEKLYATTVIGGAIVAVAVYVAASDAGGHGAAPSRATEHTGDTDHDEIELCAEQPPVPDPPVVTVDRAESPSPGGSVARRRTPSPRVQLTTPTAHVPVEV
jgi:drug/metabolite transporter (DMT)-like permease